MALLGVKTLPVLQNVSLATYQLAFRDMVVWLNNSLAIFKYNAAVSIPLPLVGFTFEMPNQLELLKYSYSSNPYLNKAQITTSYIKETTSIVVRAKRPITRYNKVPTNIATNIALMKAIEAYCDNGGTFTMLTPYGIIKNLALVSLRVPEASTSNETYGINLEFEFQKINVSNKRSSILSSAISKLTGGFL